jgi:methyl-accepting chemotaxis protein
MKRKLFFWLLSCSLSSYSGHFDIANIKVACITAVAYAPLIKEQWKKIEPYVISLCVPVVCGACGAIGTRYWLNAATQNKLETINFQQQRMQDTLAVHGSLLHSIEEKTAPLRDSIKKLRAKLKTWIQCWNNESVIFKENHKEIKESLKRLTQVVNEKNDTLVQHIALLQKTMQTIDTKMGSIEQQNDYIVTVISKIEKQYLLPSHAPEIPLIEHQKNSESPGFWAKLIKT